jgi:hypothetical protein
LGKCCRRDTQSNPDIARFKNCQAHFQRMEQRQSVRQVPAYEAEVVNPCVPALSCRPGGESVIPPRDQIAVPLGCVLAGLDTKLAGGAER